MVVVGVGYVVWEVVTFRQNPQIFALSWPSDECDAAVTSVLNVDGNSGDLGIMVFTVVLLV